MNIQFFLQNKIELLVLKGITLFFSDSRWSDASSFYQYPNSFASENHLTKVLSNNNNKEFHSCWTNNGSGRWFMKKKSLPFPKDIWWTDKSPNSKKGPSFTENSKASNGFSKMLIVFKSATING